MASRRQVAGFRIGRGLGSGQIEGPTGLGLAPPGRENTPGYLRGWGAAIKIEVLRNEGIPDGIE